jgi:hypothetical protein
MITKKIFTGIFLSAALAACSSSSPSKDAIRSDVAPAALAEVSAKEADDNNTKINIKVNHLAEPNRIDSNANYYVVWVAPRGTDTVQNVGTLNLNKDLKGTYETTVPYKDFRVMISAEKDRLATSNDGTVVFEKNIEL